MNPREQDRFNKMQQNYDNQAPVEDDSKKIDFERDVEYFENILLKDAEEYGDESLLSFLDYCHNVQKKGCSNELIECLSTVIAEATSV